MILFTGATHARQLIDKMNPRLYTPLPIPHVGQMFRPFVTGLAIGFYDSVMVIVRRFLKMAHFLPCWVNVDAHYTAKLYFQKIVRLHGVPKSIVVDMALTSL